MTKKCKGCGTKLYKYNDEKYCKRCAHQKLREQIELNTFAATLDNEIGENKNCDMSMKSSKKRMKKMKGYKQLGEATFTSGDFAGGVGKPSYRGEPNLKSWAHNWAAKYLKRMISGMIADVEDDVHDEIQDEKKEAAVMKEMKAIATHLKTCIK